MHYNNPNIRTHNAPASHTPYTASLRHFCMPFFQGPQALRLRDLATNPNNFVSMASQSFDYGNNGGFAEVFRKKAHSSHPDFGNLALLVFEAVMEVVCVSLPGYIIARMGQFDAESQKFLANLNTQLFTPCLSEYGQATRPDGLIGATNTCGANSALQSLPSSRRN